MKRKLSIAALLIFTVSLAAGEPLNQTSDVKPGMTPGSFFYPVENFVESLEVKLAGVVGGPDMKAKAIANNAEERLSEARKLSDRNRTQKVSKLVQKYSEAMNRSQELASRGQDEKLKQKLENVTAKNVKVLEEVKEKVPEEAKESIQKAIEKSKKKKPGKGKPGSKEDSINIYPKPEKSENRSRPGKKGKPDVSGLENRVKEPRDSKATVNSSEPTNRTLNLSRGHRGTVNRTSKGEGSNNPHGSPVPDPGYSNGSDDTADTPIKNYAEMKAKENEVTGDSQVKIGPSNSSKSKGVK